MTPLSAKSKSVLGVLPRNLESSVAVTYWTSSPLGPRKGLAAGFTFSTRSPITWRSSTMAWSSAVSSAPNLTERERDLLAIFILTLVCHGIGAAYVWHIGDDGRDELHLLLSNFTEGDIPGLRVTELRRSGYGSDYKQLLREAGEGAEALINKERSRAGTPLIPTLPETRVERRQARGYIPLPEIIYEA